jgi:hypothetical protein
MCRFEPGVKMLNTRAHKRTSLGRRGKGTGMHTAGGFLAEQKSKLCECYLVILQYRMGKVRSFEN